MKESILRSKRRYQIAEVSYNFWPALFINLRRLCLQLKKGEGKYLLIPTYCCDKVLVVEGIK